MKKRNFIIVLLISLSTLSLVGCGSSKKAETPAPATTTQQTTTATKDDTKSNDLDKDIKQTADATKKDDKTATDTKATTDTTANADANSDVKLITQEQAVEILKQGYIGNGVDIAYQGLDTIDNHKLLKFYTMHSDDKGSTVIDSVLYVDGQTQKVYHHNSSGVLVETIKK